MIQINGTSLASKIVTGVAIAAVLGSLAFGLKVYAFMAEGSRVTPKIMQEYTGEVYVRKDVYEVQQKYILMELQEMNDKLDKMAEVLDAE